MAGNPEPQPRSLVIDLPIDVDDDVRLLRGALLAAKGAELAEAQRRGFRHSAGYGTDSARSGMLAEVEHHRRRIEIIDRLIEAIGRAEGTRPADGTGPAEPSPSGPG